MEEEKVEITEDNKVLVEETSEQISNSEIDFKSVLDGNKFMKVVENARYIASEIEEGLQNITTNTAVLLKKYGNINIVAGEHSSSKINAEGHNTDIGFWKKNIFNTYEIETDQIIINKHKLNPYLYELTDFKKLETPVSGIVGNFCLDGTVLVKAWDTTLKKYVLIRRRLRTPMFFPQLNVPEIPSPLSVIDKTKLDISSLNVNGTTLTLEQYRASEIGKQNVAKSNSEKSPLGENTDEKGSLEKQLTEIGNKL